MTYGTHGHGVMICCRIDVELESNAAQSDRLLQHLHDACAIDEVDYQPFANAAH